MFSNTSNNIPWFFLTKIHLFNIQAVGSFMVLNFKYLADAKINPGNISWSLSVATRLLVFTLLLLLRFLLLLSLFAVHFRFLLYWVDFHWGRLFSRFFNWCRLAFFIWKWNLYF